MQFLALTSLVLNVIGAVQIAPTSFKIVQQHLPTQSQYTTYYPSKPAFLQYAARIGNQYGTNNQHGIFR